MYWMLWNKQLCRDESQFAAACCWGGGRIREWLPYLHLSFWGVSTFWGCLEVTGCNSGDMLNVTDCKYCLICIYNSKTWARGPMQVFKTVWSSYKQGFLIPLYFAFTVSPTGEAQAYFPLKMMAFVSCRLHNKIWWTIFGLWEPVKVAAVSPVSFTEPKVEGLLMMAAYKDRGILTSCGQENWQCDLRTHLQRSLSL